MKKFAENQSEMGAEMVGEKGTVWEESLAKNGLTAEETMVRENMEYLNWTRDQVWACWGSRGTRKVKEKWLNEKPGSESEIIEYYNSLELYIPELSSWHSESSAEIFSKIVEFMQICKKNGCTSYLDFGAGIGSAGILFHKFGFNVALADVSGEMLRYSKWRLSKYDIPANFIDLKSQELPINCYDCATAIEVLEHIIDPIKTVTQIVNSLKKGGLLFITTPFFADEDRPQHIIQDIDVAERFGDLGLEVIKIEGGGLYRTYCKS